MQIVIKNRQFSKSLKHFHLPFESQCKLEDKNSIRSSFEEKIDILKMPVYAKKKNNKKELPLFYHQLQPSKTFHKPTTSHHKLKNAKAVCQTRTDENKSSTVDRYDTKSTSQSWLRKSSKKYEKIKMRKNVMDVVIMEKQIEKYTSTPHEQNKNISASKDNCLRSNIQQNQTPSIMRKKSLYVLNYLKKRQRSLKICKNSQPHIWGISNLVANMKINCSPTKRNKENKQKQHRKCVIKSKSYSKFNDKTEAKFEKSITLDPW